jgi:nitrite reductase (cytochrome c-552)
MGSEKGEAYYDEMDFTDSVHPLSKARKLKAQLPDYELYAFGKHAKRSTSCADCHMPYRTEGSRSLTTTTSAHPRAMWGTPASSTTNYKLGVMFPTAR